MTAVEDKQAISENVTRYAYAVDFGEFDAFRSVLADDARAEFVMEALGRDNIDVDGADAIVERMSSRAPAPMVPRHAMVNHLVALDGDRARSRTYLANGTALYDCDHVRTARGWRIQRIEVRMFA
ncbi:MAG: nuclear transport factor 2 family protein, partial [Acidimicrobiia bacterium]